MDGPTDVRTKPLKTELNFLSDVKDKFFVLIKGGSVWKSYEQMEEEHEEEEKDHSNEDDDSNKNETGGGDGDGGCGNAVNADNDNDNDEDSIQIQTDSITCFTTKLPPMSSYYAKDSPRSLGRGGVGGGGGGGGGAEEAAPSTGDETGSANSMRSNSLVHVQIRDFESRGGVSNTYKQTGAALRR